MRVLVPGAHVFVATNPLLSHHVYGPMSEAGFEKRGEIVRIVKTRRGGDRPEGAHQEFPDVSVMPRSGWEPWGLFRKPLEGRVKDNLRRWGVGGLRRISDEQPFWDVIVSPAAPKVEKDIAPHPSLKPQRNRNETATFDAAVDARRLAARNRHYFGPFHGVGFHSSRCKSRRTVRGGHRSIA